MTLNVLVATSTTVDEANGHQATASKMTARALIAATSHGSDFSQWIMMRLRVRVCE